MFNQLCLKHPEYNEIKPKIDQGLYSNQLIKNLKPLQIESITLLIPITTKVFRLIEIDTENWLSHYI